MQREWKKFEGVLLKYDGFFIKRIKGISKGTFLAGIYIDMRIKNEGKNNDFSSFLNEFQGIYPDITDFQLVMCRNTYHNEIIDILGILIGKFLFLKTINLKLTDSFSFLTKEAMQNLIFGLKQLKYLNQITLDLSEINIHYENITNLSEIFVCLPELVNFKLFLNKSNTTVDMLLAMKQNPLLNLYLGYNNNNLKEPGLKKLLKSLKKTFPALETLNLDLSQNILRKESFVYCLKTCLKRSSFRNLTELTLNFNNNIVPNLNFLTIETSLEIFKQEIELLNIDKHGKKLKILKIYLRNNEFLIEEYLLFLKIFSFITETEEIILDFYENVNIYDYILLIKLLESFIYISHSLITLEIQFDRLHLCQLKPLPKLPFFMNMKKFTFQTKNLTFSNDFYCDMGLILERMRNLEFLTLSLPFYEYNQCFFDYITLLPLKSLKLELNYIYLFKSQCENLIKNIKNLQELQDLRLIICLRCDLAKKEEELEEADLENAVFIYENLPNLTKSLIKLINLNVICQEEEVLLLIKEREIYKGCLKGRIEFLNLEIGKGKIGWIFEKRKGKLLLIGRILEERLGRVFKRSLIKNEILEKFIE